MKIIKTQDGYIDLETSTEYHTNFGCPENSHVIAECPTWPLGYRLELTGEGAQRAIQALEYESKAYRDAIHQPMFSLPRQ